MYDGQMIGPEYDDISMAYCCSTLSVIRGSGEYWFLGRIGGTQFEVKIYGNKEPGQQLPRYRISRRISNPLLYPPDDFHVSWTDRSGDG